ncbi:MAG: hypothetical protein CVV30_02465 [Methanomicrobiales archaeon HGW-Methanomicrobiales-1]|jgi:hypothetical protein|nr:MAG: hypothetical protein CVV30_02465 [Methanomicrobiales archaeon HGW-Methanomicrobiales-1]
MKKFYLIIGCLCILAFSVMPAQAFTMKSLTITLAPDGNAEIDMQYDLSLIEQSAVFFRITDPAAELKKAFETKADQPVTVTKATSSSAVVIVPAFASVTTKNNQTWMKTPSLSFERAQKILNSYWFAPLISPDFSPATTTVIFPDGSRETWHNLISIPSVSHPIGQS